MPTDKAYGIYVMKMCEALKNAGVDVIFLYPKRSNDLKKDVFFSYYGMSESFKTKELFSIDLLSLKFLGYIPYLIGIVSFYISVLFYVLFYLRDYKYIYTRDFYGAAVFKLLGKKVIFDAHSLPLTPCFLFKFFLKSNDKIIAITEGLKKGLVDFGIPAEKIFVLPDGVDLKKFSLNISKEEAREKVNLPQNEKLIIYAGHLYKWKGVNTLFEAAYKFPTRQPADNFQFSKETLFVFVGGADKDIDKFKEKSGKENLNNILIVGRRPYNEIPLWLKAADVLILPNSGREKLSAFYTSPLKMFEYMAAGKPIVASDLPSIREVLNKENSVLVKADDEYALMEGIKKVFSDSEFADKISKNALRDAQNFSWEKRAEKFLNILRL